MIKYNRWEEYSFIYETKIKHMESGQNDSFWYRRLAS